MPDAIFYGSESPFQISVTESQLEFLRKKLELTIWPDELEGSGRDYGAPLGDVQRLAARWEDGYDWKRFERQLNEELPMFTRDIEVDGFGLINTHYVHMKSVIATAIPLLFVHGWPGSFLEVRKIIKLLANGSPDHPSFHVVAISLPGYGFSEAPKKKGFRLGQHAEVCHKLMLSLGYDEYITQGGDWGGLITRQMSKTYGESKHHKAWHTNFPLVPAKDGLGDALDDSERAGIERSKWYRDLDSGYFSIQSTRPQTIGYALSDSPVALLAWIYEKLVSWTDEYPWEDDEVLNWVSIYWFSRAGPAASVRIYYEIIQGDGHPSRMVIPTAIPTGYSYFPKELIVRPKSYARASTNVVFESQHDSGGHFAATEKPQEIVDDLRKMFGKGGPAYGVVTGMAGYAA